MAMPRRINVEFGDVFPHGAFVVSEIGPLRDFDKSSAGQQVQAVDEDTGFPIWTLDVLDGDPEARKADRQISVRIPAKHCPVLPPVQPGTPFRPVEFSGMTATPYVMQQGDARPRIAWSFRATDLAAPKAAGKPTAVASSGSAA